MWILRNEIEHLRTRLESTTIPLKLDKVQSSSKGDSFATAIAELADKSIKYEEMLWEYERRRQIIVDQIDRMDDLRDAAILYERFVRGQPIRAIADTLHYSEKYLSTLLTHALTAFEKKYLSE